MATVQLKNVSKRWGSIYGVKNVNVDIKDQEFIVILGPSGCGKTTTMRMIVGLEDPSEGEILIDGKVVNELEPKDRDIAMVFQSYGLYPHLSVYENIRFPLKVRKVDKSSHDQRVKKAASLVELGNLLERKPKELSGGQRQRVALARAIVREPKLFLMDEPLSNLDAKLRVSTRAQLKNLQYELKVTTIYVTHDQIEAMTLADQVIVMNKGEVQQIASPLEIYDKPANVFVANFIGSPPMNIIRGTVESGVFQSEGVSISGAPTHITGDTYLGFRAEDAKVVTEDFESVQIHSKVYSVESLGDSTIVNIKINNEVVCIRTEKNFIARIGESIKVSINKDSCHFFDAQTEQRL